MFFYFLKIVLKSTVSPLLYLNTYINNYECMKKGMMISQVFKAWKREQQTHVHIFTVSICDKFSNEISENWIDLAKLYYIFCRCHRSTRRFIRSVDFHSDVDFFNVGPRILYICNSLISHEHRQKWSRFAEVSRRLTLCDRLRRLRLYALLIFWCQYNISQMFLLTC